MLPLRSASTLHPEYAVLILRRTRLREPFPRCQGIGILADVLPGSLLGDISVQTPNFSPCPILNAESQTAAHPKPPHDVLNATTLEDQQHVSLQLDGSQLCKPVVVIMQ